MLKIPSSRDFFSFIKDLPTSPGVYTFKDSNRKPLYIGKAKNLRNRLKSYLSDSENRPRKIKNLMTESSFLDLVLTKNELESLLLEQHLIKEERPKYNIQFKDDKGYPWISFQINREFPSVRSYQGRKVPGDLYFGPFPSSYSVKNVLDLIQKVFKLRDCSDSFFKNRNRPCLQFEIGKCSAPCVGYISKETYLKEIQQAKALLKGNSEDLIKNLYKSMDLYSNKKEYERAALYRDKISSLREIQRSQSTSGFLQERDAITFSKSSKDIRIGVTEVRGGWIVSHKNFISKETFEESFLIEKFISNYYLDKATIPKNIVVSEGLNDKKTLEKALSNFHKKNIKIISRPGKKDKGLLEISQSNTNFSLNRVKRSKRKLKNQFKSIQKLVGSLNQIKRIEGFDISHFSGKEAVGSCIVFEDDGRKSDEYRLYRISKNNIGNDVGSLIEVVRRRYIKAIDSRKQLPDLVIIDGGLVHLKAVKKELIKLDISGIKLIALAKGARRKEEFDKLVMETGKSFKVNRRSKTHLLIQEIRDESHRFSINNQRKISLKNLKKSKLDDIKGIGRVNKIALLRYFGDIEQMKKTTVKDLMRVEGIGRDKALKIYNYFNNII
tara:strand:- start:606 stop:2432 length:1827 start_codon:yes stop_codon:yes gene_type:complete